MQHSRTSHLALFAFILICFIWGTTYYAILAGLEGGVSPFIMGSLRFIIAGLLLLVLALATGAANFNRKVVGNSMLLGAVMMGGGQGLIFWVEQHLSSGYAAVLGSSLPIWFVLMDRPNRPQYLRNRHILIGLIAGFAGIVLLFYTQFSKATKAEGWMTIAGGAAMLLSCVCWVWGSLAFKKKWPGQPLLNSLPWQVFGGMLSCMLVAMFTGEWHHISMLSFTVKAWWALLYLAVVSSVVAFVTYQWLLRQWPSAVVGTYAYITPVVALVVGYYAADEQVTLLQLIGVITILLAAFTVNKGRQQLETTQSS